MTSLDETSRLEGGVREHPDGRSALERERTEDAARSVDEALLLDEYNARARELAQELRGLSEERRTITAELLPLARHVVRDMRTLLDAQSDRKQYVDTRDEVREETFRDIDARAAESTQRLAALNREMDRLTSELRGAKRSMNAGILGKLRRGLGGTSPTAEEIQQELTRVSQECLQVASAIKLITNERHDYARKNNTIEYETRIAECSATEALWHSSGALGHRTIAFDRRVKGLQERAESLRAAVAARGLEGALDDDARGEIDQLTPERFEEVYLLRDPVRRVNQVPIHYGEAVAGDLTFEERARELSAEDPGEARSAERPARTSRS